MIPVNVIILGGGFGGLAAANELRENLPQDVRITIIDRKDWFMMDLVKLWIINGTRENNNVSMMILKKNEESWG